MSRLIMRSALLAVFSCALPMASAVADTEIDWTGDTTSDWFDTRNWSLGTVPTSVDFVVIDTISPNATVISTGGDGDADVLAVGNQNTGMLTIENGGSLSVADSMAIAEQGGTGTVIVTGAGSTLTIGDELNIADEGNGTLTIADGGVVSIGGVQIFNMGADADAVATLNIGAASGEAAVAAGTLTVDTITVEIAKRGDIIFNHTGTEADAFTFAPAISVLGGVDSALISIEAGYTIFSGDNSGFGRTVSVDGGTMVVTNNLTSDDMTVGDDNTGSELIVESAGNVAVDGNLIIGNGSAGSGSATVTGSGAALSVTGDFYVGNKGTGSLVVSSGASVTADGGSGTLTIAKESSSTGLLVIGANSGDTATDPGTVSAAETAFGSGTGTLLFNHTATSSDPLDFSSAIKGKGAIETLSGYTVLSADNSGFSGTVTVDGGTLSATGNLKASALIVGDTGSGAAMTVTDEAEVDISGDTTIGNEAGSSGSLTVSGDTMASMLKVSGGLVVGSSGDGTIIINETGSVSVDGGSGTVTVAEASGSTGTVVIGAVSGETALGMGTLSAHTVEFGDGTGSVLFNHSDDTGDFELSIALKGNGLLEIEAGTTELSADQTDFTGSTTIDGGTLAVSGALPGDVDIAGGGILSLTGTLSGHVDINSDGTLSVADTGTASGDIAVNDGGILSGTGTISGIVTVASGGTVSPGNSVGTLQTGDVTFENGSIFALEIDSDANADQLKSGGTVTLNGGTVSITADNYADDASFTIVTADTAVTGAFSGVTGGTATIGYTLSYDDTDVILTQSITQSFSGLGATDNHLAVGSALDSMVTDHPVVQHSFGAMTAAEARAIFDSLSGEVNATAKGALMDNERRVSSAINSRLDRAFSAPSAAVFAYGSGQASDPKNGAWIVGYGGWSDIGSTGNTAAADNDYAGIVGGIDREFGRHWRFGIVGAYGHTDVSQPNLSSSVSADSFSAGVYGSATHGPLYMNFGGLAGWHDIDSDRSVAIGPTMQHLTASYDASSWQLFAETGYQIEQGGMQFVPFAGVSFMQIDTDGFAETGGSAALAAASDTDSTTYTTLGLRLGRQITDTVRLHGMAGWRHAFGDIDPTTTYTLAGSNPFTVTGAPIAEDAMVIDAGFELELRDNLIFGTSYEGQFGDGATSNQIQSRLRLQF